MYNKIKFSVNYFDYIRLVAALQVAVLHTLEITSMAQAFPVFTNFLKLFPGVPIFFFISGLLISKSYEKKNSIRGYFNNRILRIYPALVVCVSINLLMVYSVNYFSDEQSSFFDIVTLWIAKITFFQFYNPEFMRGFGDGVLNGSLWTICVELQFYLIVPVIYEMARKINIKLETAGLAIILISLVANVLLYGSYYEYKNELAWKLLRVSFIPWIYMFFIGVLVQRNIDLVIHFLSKISLPIFLMVLFTALFYMNSIGMAEGNKINPIYYFVLVIFVVRLAFEKPMFFQNKLSNIDLSYGIYIWHMPILNQLLYLDIFTNNLIFIITIAGSVMVAFLSWKIIEQPMLRKKKVTIK